MPIKIFCSYAPEDEALLKQLESHLASLKQEGLIDIWHNQDISAGAEWETEISKHLNESQIILLLVSANFMNSDPINNVELKQALARHSRREARVIPIILSPVDWRTALFGEFRPLPTNGKPITSWSNPDEAFLNVTLGIRKVVEELTLNPSIPFSPFSPPQSETEEFPLLRTLTERAGHVTCIAFSPDGQILASGNGDATIKLWNPHTGELLQTLTGHTRSVLGIAFSPDRQILASVSRDSTIKLWKLPKSSIKYDAILNKVELLRTISSFCICIAFSPDGRTLASGGPGDIYQWNLTTGKRPNTFIAAGDVIESVAFSPDGQILASGSSRQNEIRLWDPHRSGYWQGERYVLIRKHAGAVNSIAFSPDGQTLASGSSDATIKLWNRQGGFRRSLTGHGGAVNSVAFSPNGQTLASGSSDSTIKLWNPHTGELLQTLKRKASPVKNIAFSPDGQILASGPDGERLIDGIERKTINIWDVGHK